MAAQDNIILRTDGSVPTPEEEIERQRHTTRFDAVAIVAGAVCLGGLFYAISTNLYPFLFVLTIALILFPLREYRSARIFLSTSAVLFGLWMLTTLAGILFPFLVAILIAYLFNPLVTLLKDRFKIGRTWSSIVIVLILCGIVGTAGWLIIPMVVNQAEALLHTLSDFFQNNQIRFDEQSIKQFFVSIGVPGKYTTSFLNEQLYPALRSFTSSLPSIALSIVAALPSVIQRTIDLILIPIASIYLLKDWDSYLPSILGLVPAKHRGRWHTVLSNIDKVLYGYIRGQSIVAMIIGFLSGSALFIAGVPYASLLGVTIAFMDLIPFVGLIASVVVVEVVILITMPITFGSVIAGVAIILGMHMVETYFLGPRIVGKGVGIPPILVFVSIFVFGYFLGFLGMLIAVPTTGIILLFVREYRQTLAGTEPGQ